MGEDCGTSMDMTGNGISHGTCEKGLVCDEPKQDLNLKEPYTLPGKCKRSGKNK